MPTRLSSGPVAARRVPRQQRSRATVDAIIEAAARVLGARGWAKFNTNEVASVAGASIGSLYQYFPDKLALAEAIRERHLDAVLAVLPDPDSPHVPVRLDTRVADLIDGVIRIHAGDQRMHHVLLEEVPLSTRTQAFDAEYLRRYQALIVPDGQAACEPRDAIAAKVLASAVEGVVHAAVSRGELDSPDVRWELNGFVCAYLRERHGGLALGG
ncbi:HTH-type transcriptional regulator BetI [Pandoraea iniqua]|uniref:TetR/AcrR family transcriptional regulator n=1 Tax=Pandoraea iniqua TaxID=2508288 RepID=UPI001240B2EE|nr:TetR/AcrR family transcriptional regulator [Pandoraea iniqua]VVE43090.1 HTH-type transcriptional regulator BetI [Pandoraea iniqua]